jgi:aminomethyltransferase
MLNNALVARSSRKMGKRSHLYQFHSEYGKMTNFAGYDMPVWYTGIVEEHMAVRNNAGLFDVSHMGRVGVKGEDSMRFLDHILPTKVADKEPGRAFYSLLCNENAGIIDDVVAERIGEDEFIVVVNASNREKDLSWVRNEAIKFNVEINDISDSTALIAIQGPLSKTILQEIADRDPGKLKRFHLAEFKVSGESCLVSRTGYTGEDGFEIMVYDTTLDEPSRAMKVWQDLLESGKSNGLLPCGLGARDSLRLEAGMCLYGQDIDEKTSPVEADLMWVVDMKKPEFIGSDTIEHQEKNGVERKRMAFSMVESGIPRHEYGIVFSGERVGTVTSGSFSPIAKRGIGMGYVKTPLAIPGTNLWIKIREIQKLAQVVSTPFYDTTKFGYKRST